MTNYSDLTLTQTLNGLKNKDFKSSEVTEHYITASQASSTNAFITFSLEKAQEQAKDSDERYANGDQRLLDGIPIGMKDLFCTNGIKTTAASKMLENFIPPYESTVSQNLFNNGAIIIGKTNLDEFAMGSANINSAFGNVINPWSSKSDGDIVPGGSSGGSAAAVAGRMVLGATGTDTGGSIRQPASFCGISGIKPTYGRCSRWGTIAFASSLDQAGPMARTVEDCAIFMQAMAGHDAKDSTSADKPVPNWSGDLTDSIKGKTIGIPKEYRVEGMPDDIEKLWDQGKKWLRDAGANVVDITLPHTHYALPTYYIIAPAEASSNLARYDGVRYGLRVADVTLNDQYELTRAAGFGDEVKRRILIGTHALSSGYYDAYYIKAQKVRRLISNDFVDAFQKCDAILTPTAPSAAFKFGENTDDPVKMYLNDVFTVPASLAGLPAMSIPAGLNKNGLPLGLQIIGKSWDEQTVLDVSYALQNAASFPFL